MEPTRPTSLPAPVVALLGRVLALGGTRAVGDEVLEAATDQLMEAVGFVPSEARSVERPILLAGALTAEQRAVAEALAGHPEVPRGRWPLYWTPWLCRRWLGLEPGGVLFREVELELEGRAVRWPLVHALRHLLAADADERARALVDALPLPARVEALVGLHLAEPDLEALAFSESLAETTLALLREDVGAGDWARALADWVLAEREEHDDGVAMLLFAALVATGTAIEPRHDALLRLSWGDFAELGRRCIAAIPSERRQAAMVGAIEAAPFPSHRIRIGLAYLPDFPYPSVARVVLAELDRADDPAGVLERLEELAAEHPGIAEMVAAVRGSMPPVPELRVGSVLQPVTLEALDDVRRRQLELAEELYGGGEATAAEILARGDDDEDGECIHPSCLELRTIVGPDGEPRYDAWLYMGDSGTIFAAGTEQVVAEVIQCGLETGDRILRLALPAMLGWRDRAKRKRSASAAKGESKATTNEVERTTKTTKKKAATKKTPAKKTPAKKTPAKKTPAKKAATKKAATKKAATKKAATKKTPAKKTPAKKTPAKKAATKQATTKKPATKKPSGPR